METLIHNSDGKLVLADPWAPGAKVKRTGGGWGGYRHGDIGVIAESCGANPRHDRIHIKHPVTGVCFHHEKCNVRLVDG